MQEHVPIQRDKIGSPVNETNGVNVPILLTDINPDAVYDADEIAALCNNIHRTTVHQRIFPCVRTQRVARRMTTTGAELIRYLRGETSSPTKAS